MMVYLNHEFVGRMIYAIDTFLMLPESDKLGSIVSS